MASGHEPEQVPGKSGSEVVSGYEPEQVPGKTGKSGSEAVPGKSSTEASKAEVDEMCGEGPSTTSWLIRCPCIGPRDDKGVWADPIEAPDSSGTFPQAKGLPIIVHTATPGGVEEKQVFPRHAIVQDVRRAFKTLNGKQYKLLKDGQELSHDDKLEKLLDADDSNELHLTKVNILHPVDLDSLTLLETKKDSFNCEVFTLGVFVVSMGMCKYGQHNYSSFNIEDPQKDFHKPGKLEPYRQGYDYFDTVEKYNIGEGRFRYRMPPNRKKELEDEFGRRLPEFRCLSAQVFENPNRIYKLRTFMDSEVFPCTRENLYRFLNVFLDILTDKSTTLL